MSIAETVYVRFFNLLRQPDGDCLEPCEEVLSPFHIEPCFELTRIDQCTWEGTATQDAECFPVSTLRLMLGCDGNEVTITLYWYLTGDDVAIYQRVVPAEFLACSGCLTHELDPIDHGVGCDTRFSWAQINFGQFGMCCEHCPDSYQITIEGVSENDVEEKCEDADCQQLNGVYQVDFVGRGRAPTGACTDGLADWCEYMVPLDLRCTDTRYGFCSLHLFVKTTDNCGTKLRVELRSDVHDTDDCDAIDVRQGWQKDLDGSVGPIVNCFDIDATMTRPDVCLDANWNCDALPVVVRVQAPDVVTPLPTTRLTPLGMPGRRYL